MGRVLPKLVVLALVGVGLWALYQRFGNRARRLGGPAHEFATRSTDAAREAGRAFEEAGGRAVGAATNAAEQIKDAASSAADKISDAAVDAGHQATTNLTRD